MSKQETLKLLKSKLNLMDKRISAVNHHFALGGTFCDYCNQMVPLEQKRDAILDEIAMINNHELLD